MVDSKNTATKGWWMAGITGEAVIKKTVAISRYSHGENTELPAVLGILSSRVAVLALVQRMSTDNRSNFILKC